MGIALLAFACAALVLAEGRSVLSIPRADDWSYVNVTFQWAQDGTMKLNGWVHMMFVSQGLFGLALISTLGKSVVTLQLLVLGMGIIGLLMVYVISVRLLSPFDSMLVLLLTGLSPLWLYLSVTFMTDVPAWSLSLVSIGLGVAAIRSQRPIYLALGFGFAVLAFGVREYAVVPFCALLLWVILSKHPRSFKFWSLNLSFVGVVVIGATYVWRQSLPGSVETVLLTPIESLVNFTKLLISLSLLLAPYAALGVIRAWPSRGRLSNALRTRWLGAALGIAVAIGLAMLSSGQLAGNVIHPYGASWTSVGDGVRALPLWAFRAVTLVGVLGLVGLMALVGMIVQSRVASCAGKLRERPQFSNRVASLYVFISVTVMIVYLVAILVAGAPAFDRYLLFVVPLLGILLLWLATRSSKESISKWQKGAVTGILIVTGAFGVVITDGLNQMDGLRWQVASKLVESGIPAYKIDGGDAWFRYHQKNAPGVAQVGSLENSIPGRTWWQTFFEGSSFCRIVGIESETDLQAIYGPALSIQEERTLLGTPFKVMVFPGPDPC